MGLAATMKIESQDLPEITEADILAILSGVLEAGTESIRASSRFKDHTGTLRNVQMRAVTMTRIAFGSPQNYASFVNNGRGEVRPVRAKVLHWKSGGKDFFSMRSGPAAPRPFFDDAVAAIEQAMGELSSNLEFVGKRWTTRTGGRGLL